MRMLSSHYLPKPICKTSNRLAPPSHLSSFLSWKPHPQPGKQTSSLSSCRSREQYSINADVIGAAASKEFADREKAKAAKKTATPRLGVDGLPPSGSQPEGRNSPMRGLRAHKALKAHTSPRCGGGL
jgi:hypothetical protein